MSELVAVGFKNDKYRASDVLDQLRQLEFDWVIDLDDAVAVYRDYNGKLRVQQSYELTTGEGAAWGGLWGSLIGAILAIPFTAGASAAVAAGAVAAGALSGTAVGATAGAIDASWWKEDFGLDEEFVRNVGALIQPGDSAILALIESSNPGVVAAQFKGYGGTVLRSSLTPAQAAKLEDYLRSGRTAA
jgi:uncharacterized membrane protein